MRILIPLLAMLVAALPAHAADPAPPPAATADADKHQAELLGYAVSMISKGQQAQAISMYLDPLINYYEAANPPSKRRVYSARDLTATLFYMTLAARDKTDAVALGPTWGEAYFYKGFALVDIGKPGEARAMFEKAIALAPMDARFVSELGSLYQTEKNWPKALETFRSAAIAADLSPDPVKIYEKTRALRGQGFALTEMGRYDESEAVYRKCLALNPKDQIAEGELRYIAQLRSKTKPLPST